MHRLAKRLGVPVLPALLVLLLLLPGAPVSAQFALGGHVTLTELDLSEADWAFGGRAVAGVPLTGLGAQVTLDVFETGCETEGCRSQVLGAYLLYSFPVPFVMNPYVGGGVSFDASDDFDFDWDVGEMEWNLVAGVILGGPAFPTFKPFAEGRYELRDGRAVFSAGVLLYLF
jgi:hypothetical protein